ncbi:hypothetical protein F383_29847 [Gossypium arboreum]|uniref:Uncharacterized protein n=1 Tax=Gossypium arboreum TaxID=29729 RepID=A0A0B0MUE0_GOSAR|nr:hypothetical protein F383_29847 [Gossypium arboreum]
MPMRHYMCRLL